MSSQSFTLEEIKLEQASFIRQVYTWMALALTITGVVAYITASVPALLNIVFMSKWTFYGLLIAELACVFYMTAAIKKMSATTALICFVAYAILNGLTLSIIFLIYTAASIATTFFVTAGTFAVMSIYGYFTKKDLTTVGNLAFMALIGIIIASIVNIFMKNEMLYWIITYAGILIFVGLTAYDTQKIKNMNIIGNEGTDEDRKEAIMGALTLYLDFINLFLYLLRVLGRRK